MTQAQKFGTLLLVVGLVGAAAFLRFHDLADRCLWHDELLSWRMGSFPLSVMIERSGETKTVHPPFYFLLLHFWIALFGTSEFALRSLAATFGVLATIAAYFLTRELEVWAGTAPWRGPSTAAVTAAALVALSPIQIHGSQQVRHYSLGVFLILASSLALLRALRAGRRAGVAWLSYIVLATCCCFTHHLLIPSILAHGFFCLAVLLNLSAAPAADARASKKAQWRWLVITYVTVLALYFVWVPRITSQAATAHQGSWLPLFSFGAVGHNTLVTLAATPNSRVPSIAFFDWFVTAELALLILFVGVRFGAAGLFLLLSSFIPVFCILFFSWYRDTLLYHPRYLAFAEVFWLLSIAFALQWIHSLRIRKMMAVGLILGAVGLCYVNWDELSMPPQPGMREAARYIETRLQPLDLVLADRPSVYLRARYYLDPSVPVYFCTQNLDRLRHDSGSQLDPADFLNAKELSSTGAAGFWLVTDNRPSLTIPSAWREVGTLKRTFPQQHRWENRLLVQYFVPAGFK